MSEPRLPRANQATSPGPEPSTPEAAGEAIALGEEARELVALEVGALLPGLSPSRRSQYEALAECAGRGSVSPELIPLLERVVALALETGRARQLYRAEGERVLSELFRRTPRGRELVANLEAVNRALAVLAGRPLQGLRVAMRTLGHFTLAIETAGASLTLAVRRDSVAVESLGVGGVDAGSGPG